DALHFMRLKPVKRRVRVLRGGVVLAETDAALRLLEIGGDMYDPALYLPAAALRGKFSGSDKTTFCPLKGEAHYLSLLDGDGNLIEQDIAWSYPAPLGFAHQLAGLVSFYSDRVTIEEAPL
ncbi:MAG: DUF427 domain-containing protein, partial [Paracoccaceae bacterium]